MPNGGDVTTCPPFPWYRHLYIHHSGHDTMNQENQEQQNEAESWHNASDFLPDYAFGRLIFHDDFSDDNMKWIVYDGRTKVRCISKKAAYHYVAQQANVVGSEAINFLMVGHHHLTRGYKSIDRAAPMMPVEVKLECEAIALAVRRLADKIDSIIAQNLPK